MLECVTAVLFEGSSEKSEGTAGKSPKGGQGATEAGGKPRNSSARTKSNGTERRFLKSVLTLDASEKVSEKHSRY